MKKTKSEFERKKFIITLMPIYAALIISVMIIILLLPYIKEFSICLKTTSVPICSFHYWNYIKERLSGRCYIREIANKGVSTEKVIVPVDVYVVQPLNFTEKDIDNLFTSLNSVWSDYGIEFSKNSTNWVVLGEKEVIPINSIPELKITSEKIVGNNLYKTDRINLIISDRIKEKQKVLFWKIYKKSGIEGVGRRSFDDNSSINIVFLSTQSKNITWVLSHEMGHSLGLLDKAFFMGEYNLMTHVGCIKDNFYPTLLSQSQVDVVVETAKNMKKSNNI